MRILFYLGILLVSLFSFSCARVGSPVGGMKDTLAPIPVGVNIDSPFVRVPRDFRALKIKFNEYITLKDIQKNLIISPSINNITRIIPSNLATKELVIEWKDTLQANTTYSFNFGNAIQDNNEGNKLPYYTFAFSTGDKLDDLYLSGTLRNGYTVEKKQNNSESTNVIGLYKDGDSIDYKKKPLYINRADEDGYYEINYLSPGRFRVVAFDDKNANSIYDPGEEDIAFLKEPISLEESKSRLELILYPSQKPVRYVESKEIPGGVLFLFEGNPKELSLINSNEEISEYKVLKKPFSDSVTVYFDLNKPPFDKSSAQNIAFEYNADGKKGKMSIFYKKTNSSELTLSSGDSRLVPPKGDFVFTSNYDIESIDTSTWSLREDSLTTKSFTAEISPKNASKIRLKADFQEGKKYTLVVPKGTVKSYFASNDKGYSWDFEGDKITNYGSFTFRFSNLKADEKYWIQFIDSNGKIVTQIYTQGTELKLPFVSPGEYQARLLIDENGNGIWEGANLEKNRFAEPVYIFPKKISIRPLWELVEDWELK